jgi:hypothetical protein
VVNIGTLTNQGGPVMDSAVQHAIYLLPSNHACPSVVACWGNPEQFLSDLSRSEFILVADQYVGTTGNGRYGVGVSGHLNYTIPAKPLSTQNSILSHELIESITDPDGDAWWNASGDLDLYGYEIGDECQWIFFSPTSVGFLLDPVYLNGRLYYIQSEYNDHANGCTDGPGPGGD